MRKSSYNLILILLKLCRHCDHALKICMWFGYNPQINFCHFFLQFELSHFLDIFYILKVTYQLGALCFINTFSIFLCFFFHLD